MINIGVGGGNGMLAQVAFRNAYPDIPKVVFAPVSASSPNVYITRTISGFTFYNVGGLSPGSYVFDYIVMQ